ncbi:MAG: CAP domain-containing protein [Marmoricola sp.]
MRENKIGRGVAFAGATIVASMVLGMVLTTSPATASDSTGYRSSARWTGAVNTGSLAAVNSAYWANYAPKYSVLVDWLGGSLLGCLPGLTSSVTNQATLSALNYVRSLAGLAPVTFSSTMNSDAQRAALIMAANNALSHTPTSNWKCWSSRGAAVAGKSNLALAYPSLKAGQIIDLYMDDKGDSNVAVGHRRWILNPFSTVMGSGTTSTANALTVIGPTNAYRPNPAYVGWPSAGYFPNALEPGGRWSLSSGSKAVSFRYAKIYVYRADGVQVPVHKYAVHSGYAQPTVVWQMPSSFNKSTSYKIGITGIKKSGYSGSLRTSYTVRLFTPSQ